MKTILIIAVVLFALPLRAAIVLEFANCHPSRQSLISKTHLPRSYVQTRLASWEREAKAEESRQRLAPLLEKARKELGR